MKRGLLLKKFTAAVLMASIVTAVIPEIAGDESVNADAIKNQSNTCLGTSGIASPVPPSDEDDPWSGSYVYFGNYDGNPIRFRVLAPQTSVYGGSTMFLDSDEILFESTYYSAEDALNGSFLTDSFTLLENEAIATSIGTGSISDDSENPILWTCGVNDKVFLLDYTEVLYPAYGYSTNDGWYTGMQSINNHLKNYGEEANGWWLRSSYAILTEYYRGAVLADGTLALGHVGTSGGIAAPYPFVADSFGAAPALNVDLSSVIFSSLITGSFNTVGTEYKLTVSDPNLDIAIQAGRQATIAGSTVTIPYCISGTDAANATRASVLVTTGEYNAEGSQILYYDSLGSGSTGIGTFTLPSELTLNGWGSDYNVYILAEDINGTYETDYASVPVKVDAPISGATMYRLYNPNSGEHFYTASAGERNHLISLGWNDEGIGWIAPVSSNTPVYRLYNQYGGEHHYTTSIAERDHLISLGWNDEGIGWYSDDARTVPLYRQYNPNAFANNHNYTTSLSENNWLVSIGWQAEGIGWYGIG